MSVLSTGRTILGRSWLAFLLCPAFAGQHPAAFTSPPQASTTATWFGQDLRGGDITDVAVSPTNPDVVLAGRGVALPRGLFRSTNGGGRWSKVPEASGFPSSPVGDLEFGSDGRAWAATDAGLFLSSDGGVTWIERPLGLPLPAVAEITIDSGDPNSIWVGMWDGPASVLHSSDGGVTWIDRSPPGSGGQNCRAIALDPDDSDRVFVTRADAFLATGRVLVSNDAGITWVDRTSNLPSNEALVDLQFFEGKLYVGGGRLENDQSFGLYSTNDAGLSWQVAHDASWPALFTHDLEVVQTGDDAVLWAATPRGPLFLDNGSWVSPTTSLHVNAISAGSNAGEILFAVRSVGVWKQTAGGVIGNSSLGIEELRARSVDSDPTNPLGVAVAVASNFSGGVFTTNDTVAWQLEPLPAGTFQDVVYGPDGTLYSVCSGPDHLGARTGVYRRDATSGWEFIGPDAPNVAGSGFRVLHIGDDPNLLLLGGSTSFSAGRRAVIWRSVDAGANWSLSYEGEPLEEVTDIEEVLDGQGQDFVASFTQPISQLAGAVLRSSNAGQSWTRIALGPPQGAFGETVASDPLTPTNLYLGDTTFQQERLFRSSDGGVSWSTIPGSEGANRLDFHPLSDTTLFATSPTAPAVRLSEDAGQSFTLFDEGLDEAGSVTDFVVDDRANFAYLTTTRGLWVRPLSDVVRYCAAASNSVGSGARMDWAGSTSASSADLELLCNDLPPGQPGLFFHGPAQFNLPFGNGRRCVGAGMGLVVRLPIVTSDASGMSSYGLSAADYASIPPGSTRFFQYWYRDPAGGGSSFNLSDALAIRFGL